MKCPVCKNPDLLMSERQGVEIDYCPECRGIWLDRAELDKIIERSIPNAVQHNNTVDKHSQYIDPKDQYKYHKKRKRESFLSDIFDFD